MKASQAPLLLGRICGAWRAISLSTPALWDRIHIIAPVMKPSNDSPSKVTSDERKRMTDLLVLAVEEWLERSQMRPLSISLTAPRTFRNHPLDLQLSYSLFNVILCFYHRWQNVTIHVLCLYSAVTISMLANTDSMPWLASLDLRGPLGSNNIGGLPLLFVAPKLHKMSLHWMRNFTTIHFPWHQLTELVLYLVPIMDRFEHKVVDLLSVCTRLEKFSANIRMAPSFVPRHDTLPFLKSFRLLEDVDAANFVSAIHLPALRHLAFCATHSIRGSLLDLLRRFGGQLETLYLGMNICRGVSSQVWDYLRLTPQLIRFGIEKSQHFGANFTRKVRESASQPTFLTHLSDELCPLLEELYLMAGVLLSDQQLLDFILSRRGSSRHGVSNIKQMTAVFHRNRQIDIAKRLSDLGEDEGLILRLVYGEEAADRIALGYTLPLLSDQFAN